MKREEESLKMGTAKQKTESYEDWSMIDRQEKMKNITKKGEKGMRTRRQERRNMRQGTGGEKLENGDWTRKDRIRIK